MEECEGRGCGGSYVWRHGGGWVAAWVRLLLAIVDLAGYFGGSSDGGDSTRQ